MKLKKLTLIFTIFIIVINLLRPASFAVTSTESDIQIYSDGAVLMDQQENYYMEKMKIKNYILQVLQKY